MTQAHVIRFWARLAHLEAQAKSGNAIPSHIEKLAAKFDSSDPVYAQFCREAHDPKYIRASLSRIRFKAENVSIDDAIEALTSLQDRALHVETLALRRDIITGRKQNQTLDESRDKANKIKKTNKLDRRERVAEIIQNSSAYGGALEDLIAKKLRKLHGIHVSKRTIRRDLENLKKVGQTG